MHTRLIFPVLLVILGVFTIVVRAGVVGLGGFLLLVKLVFQGDILIRAPISRRLVASLFRDRGRMICPAWFQAPPVAL